MKRGHKYARDPPTHDQCIYGSTLIGVKQKQVRKTSVVRTYVVYDQPSITCREKKKLGRHHFVKMMISLNIFFGANQNLGTAIESSHALMQNCQSREDGSKEEEKNIHR